jgi:monoamine oxidase
MRPGCRRRSLMDQPLAQLARLFPVHGERPAGLLEDGRAFDWQADPFSRGAYSYVPVGGQELVRRLVEPVADTLLFAGEATDYQFAGTVAGALASGARGCRSPGGPQRPGVSMKGACSTASDASTRVEGSSNGTDKL